MCESVEVDRIIIPPAAAKKIVDHTNQIYLRKCICRASKGLCPPEIWEVCLLFEDAPQKDLWEGHLIPQQEALAILDKMDARQAIYNLFYQHTTGKITELCSCCTCCCEPLNQLKENGDYAQQLRTSYVAITDAVLCTGCGSCLDHCFFSARQLTGGEIKLVDDHCFGCGRCIGACPENAIRLEVQAGRGSPIQIDLG